ncbi:Protein of unknown function DUF58 [Catalinimonas alkaloidigena]|uniref:DUF58 domain-containing protein n=1 Tax=Catalinimonas alkaloidigena TaxID=1075417 RepID=A0A1G9L032_9BACT|nr:DUF58 domain-containing protein [Catalinimonas alkaloidigena]SDL54935.1 Protein of unknown function DUF58 [Catalinimonas alkaloidigena]
MLDPHLLQSIEGLELLARSEVEGFLAGANRSPRSGTGAEFRQYRTYQPGDDLRQLDWKMYARSDRYYIKESEVETNLTVQFVLDTSASMRHRDGALSKLDYARALVASLGYLARKQGDALGLHALNDRRVHHLTPRTSPRFFHHFLHELTQLEAEGRWPSGETLNAARRSKELVIVLSDMYEQEGEISRFLAERSALRQEVLLFHLLGKNELTLEYEGATTFEDLETGAFVEVDPAQARAAYVRQLEAYLEALRKDLLEKRIGYARFLINEPLAEALSTFLKLRKRMG